MVRTLLRSALREIRQSLGRYLAIMAIVGLGVGFFAGLRTCQPAMMETGVRYMDTYRLYDFRVLSTLGFTEEDVADMADLPAVAAARGAVYTDFLTSWKGEEIVLKAHSLTEGVNVPELVSGRMPEAADQCLADARYFTEADLGTVLTVAEDNDEDTRSLLRCGSYTVVGLCRSPYYLNYERGTGSIGSGSVSAFIYIPQEGFDFEAYYEIFLAVEDPGRGWSDGYQARIDDLTPSVEDLAEILADRRYTGIRSDAEIELLDAQTELDDGWETYRAERSDAEAELAEAYQKLLDGEQEYADGLTEYEQGRTDYADGLREYREGLAEIADAEAELEDAKAELTDAAAGLADGKRQLIDGEAELLDAQEELASARQELDDGWADYYDGEAQAKAELQEAYRTLADGEAEYEAGEAQLAEGQAELDEAAAQIAAGEAELAAAEAELAAAWEQLEAARALLDQGEAAVALYDAVDALAAGFAPMLAPGGELPPAAFIAILDNALANPDAPGAAMLIGAVNSQLADRGMTAGDLTAGWRALEAVAGEAGVETYIAGLRASLPEGEAAYAENLTAYEAGRAQTDAFRGQLEDARGQLSAGRRELAASRRELASARQELDAGWADYYDGEAQVEAELAEAREKLTDGEEEYAAGLADYEQGAADLAQARLDYEQGAADYAEGLAQYESGEAELASAKAELAAAETKLRDARAELDSAPAELADARRELDDGWADYYDGAAEAEEKFADAEAELADAQREIDDGWADLAELKTPTTYVLTRGENTGYAAFDSDTAIVAAISLVFPVFFFLVAALVCMTTMTRMVDEQRTQIGVLKALGYSNGQIMAKYLFYSGSAAVVGSIAGYALGSTALPWVIWEIYGVIYGFAPLRPVFRPALALVSFAAALLCSMGATWAACRTELRRQAAELIRPKAPKAGRRVLLERVGPLWRRLSFLYKVSVRNVFRYRSRLVMMVLGIGGCTALLATGFGIRDSIAHVADDQFDEITLYDYTVTFQRDQTQQSAAAYLARHGWEEDQGLLVHSGSVDVVAGTGSKSVYLVVSSTSSLDGFLSLHSGEKTIPYPGEGEAVLNRGLAKKLGIQAGDTVTLRDEKLGTMDVTVSAVCDNYVFNYVYVSPETYAHQLGQAPGYNTLYVLARQEADPYAEGAALREDEDVGNVAVNAATRDRVDNMLARLDYIVVVVVLCAGALAFIVLYNLTNINITERTREIATIKVLGFYQNEVTAYVFREIAILSVLGSLTGLVMGKALHAYVMAQIQIDAMFFACRIAPSSYGLSLALTMLFTAVIALGMGPRLRRIDMAESLKSVE